MNTAARRRLRKAMAHDDGPVAGELNITPLLDVIMNLVCFLLATTAAIVSISQITTRLPGGGPIGDRSPSYMLSVFLTERGALVRDDRGVPEAVCEGALDGTQLRACLVAVKRSHPDHQQAILSAEPRVAFERVVAAMDVVRADGSEPLFPDVLVSAGVR